MGREGEQREGECILREPLEAVAEKRELVIEFPIVLLDQFMKWASMVSSCLVSQ